jgi:small subunit ribosomal protein S17
MAKKILFGTVVSDKMTNTVVVSVERQTVHPLYKKRLKVTKKYSVDSREVRVTVGDFVKIEETVPMSKTKYFKVIEKISEDVVLKLKEDSGDHTPGLETVELTKPVEPSVAKAKDGKETKKTVKAKKPTVAKAGKAKKGAAK